MDDEGSQQDNFTSPSLESGSNATQYAGAFFPHAQHLNISGGTFTSHVTRVAPTIPRDFRMIALGDLDLLHEIRPADRSSVVARKRSGGKLYHVRLDGRISTMTAAVYHEREGEEEWRRELQTYSGIRHPNVVQIYGAVNSSGLSATIFHDELIPLSRYYDLYKDSPLVYIYVKYWKILEFMDALGYLDTHGVPLIHKGYTPWIKQSTGSLAVDVMRSSEEGTLFPAMLQPTPYIPRPGFNVESTIVSSLSFLHFYISLATGANSTWNIVTSRYRPIALGAFVHFARDNPAQFVKLASVPISKFNDDGWCCGESRGVAMQNGWTRFQCSKISDSAVSREFRTSQHDMHVWFSQATHILSSLQITDSYEEYGWIQVLEFLLRLEEHLPDGYLFLCPLNDLQTPADGFFQTTDSQAYWSLDASGIQKLSVEEAVSLGFPALVLQVGIFSTKWGEYEYGALRQFYQAKGFDPDSQDVARHLGYPLYQIYPQTGAPFAHIEEEPSDTGIDDATTQFTTEHEMHESHVSPNSPRFLNDRKFIVLGALGVVFALVLSLSHFLA